LDEKKKRKLENRGKEKTYKLKAKHRGKESHTRSEMKLAIKIPLKRIKTWLPFRLRPLSSRAGGSVRLLLLLFFVSWVFSFSSSRVHWDHFVSSYSCFAHWAKRHFLAADPLWLMGKKRRRQGKRVERKEGVERKGREEAERKGTKEEKGLA